MKCDPTLYRAAPPSLAVKPRLIRHLFLPPLIILLMLALGLLGFWISEHYGIRSLGENGQRQLELHARAVESEISKYTYLPSLLELESSVSKLLAGNVSFSTPSDRVSRASGCSSLSGCLLYTSPSPRD